MTRAKVILAERFQQAPFGPWAQMSAAQVAVLAAALREDDAPTAKESSGAQALRQQQPRLNRDTLLEIARQNDPAVRDARER